MKSRLTLAIVGCAVLTLLNPYILTAQARNIGTNRQPRTCPSRTAPTSGAISGRQAAIYAACERESDGYQNNYSTKFMDILSVQVSKPRQVNSNDFRVFNNIDTTKPAYDLQGSVVHYLCYNIGETVHTAGKNCTISRLPESVGVCVQNTFGKWFCSMSYYTPTQEYHMPPPQ
jgi:hypothetical protein